MAASKTKKGLGRGLSALIPDDMAILSAEADLSGSVASATAGATSRAEGSDSTTGARPGPQLIAVSSISPNPYQPRRHFVPEEMEDLVESIREHGLIQPVLVRPMPGAPADAGPTTYQLVAGERRWRAAQQAGVAEIPAVIRDVDDQQALELAVIENVQRHDISPLEAALAYKRLADEFNLSQEEIARRVGKSRSGVANTMRLLDLPDEIQKSLEDGALSEGHGRAILLAQGDGARRAIFRRILRDKLSVREAERLARESEQAAGAGNSTAEAASRDLPNPPEAISRIQESLQKALGTKVKLQPRAKGGRLQIEYYSNEDLSRIIEMILKTKS